MTSYAERAKFLALLKEDISTCTDCGLHKTRTQTVFGRGSPIAPIVLIGEAPGEEEDLQGDPFVGRSGKLLDAMIEESGLESYYICNAIKCRPPQNRTPTKDELTMCAPFFSSQLKTIDPKVVVALGLTAARALGVESQLTPTGWRGTVVPPARSFYKFRTLVTFHPAYVLRQPGSRRYVVQDLRRDANNLVEAP